MSLHQYDLLDLGFVFREHIQQLQSGDPAEKILNLIVKRQSGLRRIVARQKRLFCLLHADENSVIDQHPIPIAQCFDARGRVSIESYLGVRDQLIPHQVCTHAFVLHPRRHWTGEPIFPCRSIDVLEISKIREHYLAHFFFGDERHSNTQADDMGAMIAADYKTHNKIFQKLFHPSHGVICSRYLVMCLKVTGGAGAAGMSKVFSAQHAGRHRMDCREDEGLNT